MMRRALRWAFVVLVASVAAFASAIEVPDDAQVLVTDASSRIVGVGHVTAGVRMELVLEDGFAGAATWLWLLPDGGLRRLAVVVNDGMVWVDGRTLTSLLPARFLDVRIRSAADLGGAWPPDPARGPPADLPASGPPEGRGPPDGVDPPGLDDEPGGPPGDVPGEGNPGERP